ncbi:hypothetical protein RKD33_006380 [Streptomyces sp. SAI-129]
MIQEVAKFRAARRIWARVMKEEFGAKNPKSLMLRFHTQTAGVQLTAQQPEVNLVRVAVQGLGAVLGGTQSLHTNPFVADPTERLKLFLGNRYEHYQPTTARQRHSDGRELLVFKWVYRTYVAE